MMDDMDEITVRRESFPRETHVDRSGLPRSTEAVPPAAAVSESLLEAHRRDDMRARWREIQSSFIDEPARAVDDAEAMIRELLTSLPDQFEETRHAYRGHRDGDGVEPSTESLRRALQAYRSLFDRLSSL